MGGREKTYEPEGNCSSGKNVSPMYVGGKREVVGAMYANEAGAEVANTGKAPEKGYQVLVH